MTFLWVLCGWTLMGVPLGMAVGGALARKNAYGDETAAQAMQTDMPMYTEMPVCM